MLGRRSSNQPDIAGIIEGVAAKQEQQAPAEPADAEVRKLAERLDLLVADFGQWTEYKAASVDYVRQFSKELAWHRVIRVWVAIACGVVVVGLAALLVTVLCLSDRIFGDNPGNALTALIVACVGGIVVVTIAALRGAFAPLKERNEGLPMPEHIKQVVELGQGMFGRG